MESKIVLTMAIVAVAAFALLTASSLLATNVFSQNASNAANQTKEGASAAMNNTSAAASNAANQTKEGASAAMNNTSAAASNVTQGAGAALNQTGKALSNTGNDIMQGLKNLFGGGNNTQK
jgi:hypothetical protein